MKTTVYKHACPYCGATVDSGLITKTVVHHIELEEKGDDIVDGDTFHVEDAEVPFYCDECMHTFKRFIQKEVEVD